MLPRRFDRARPFATLAVVVLAWVLIPIGAKLFVRASFFELTAPVPVAASYVRDLQEYWSLRGHSSDDLIGAGRDLARVNASYDLAVQQNAELRAQVERMEKLLNIPPPDGFRYEPARVVQRDFNGWWQRLIIRKGKNYGLPVGAPVVFGGGVVGRLSQVRATTSVVEMISSQSFRIAAVIEGESRAMSFQGGDNPTFGPARGVVEFVPLDVFATSTTPKRLVTSGFSDVFPPGLLIGQIVRIEPSNDGLFKTGEVQLDPRLAELTDVTVLVRIPAELNVPK